MLWFKNLRSTSRSFYMCHFGHSNPKKTLLWSTTPYIRAFDCGQPVGAQREAKIKLSKKYTDRSGNKRWHGTKDLKASGLRGYIWSQAIQDSVPRLDPYSIST